MPYTVGNRTYHAQGATRIKPQELGQVNDFYLDLTEDPCRLAGLLDPTSVYLWILREDGHLIIGRDTVNRTPQHLNEGVGHPTLAVNWSPDGTMAGGANAYIGGELKRSGGNWRIDNNSGRFGSAPGGGKKTLLYEVKKLFSGYGSLHVTVRTYSRHAVKRFFQQKIFRM